MGDDTCLRFRCACVVKVVMHTCGVHHYYSTTIQQNRIKFGVLIPVVLDSSSFSPSMHHCGSFSFGVANVLVFRFEPPIQMYS